jgi:hypothetical protein
MFWQCQSWCWGAAAVSAAVAGAPLQFKALPFCDNLPFTYASAVDLLAEQSLLVLVTMNKVQ